MEVWALYAYGAAHILQEVLTIKSDDVVGRVRVYESLVKGKPISSPGVPESFRVLIKEFQALGLDIQIINKEGEVKDLRELENIENTEGNPISIEELKSQMPLEEDNEEDYEDVIDEEDEEDDLDYEEEFGLDDSYEDEYERGEE